MANNKKPGETCDASGQYKAKGHAEATPDRGSGVKDKTMSQPSLSRGKHSN